MNSYQQKIDKLESLNKLIDAKYQSFIADLVAKDRLISTLTHDLEQATNGKTIILTSASLQKTLHEFVEWYRKNIDSNQTSSSEIVRQFLDSREE